MELLLAAADAGLLNDAAAALRLATRAQQAEQSVKAAVMVSSAQSELGRPDLARATLEAARPPVPTESGPGPSGRSARRTSNSRAGEGLFRSEPTAELVIVLAELGEVDEAVAIMRDHPPDEVAIIPGLLPWAQSGSRRPPAITLGPPVPRSRRPGRPPRRARPRWR